ncbi:MAG: shikimate 5-dehydrogenase [Acuticoccus sp.]
MTGGRPGAASPPITGRTRFIAHLGLPTEAFKAPLIYNPYFADVGIDCVVVPMGCAAAGYAAFLRQLFALSNIAGALVTMPHKMTTAGLVDEASAAVAICGACNAVKAVDGRLVGDNFDGEGFLRGVLRKGRAVAGASAIVAGAGGVGSAIAAALAGAGLARLALYDVDAARADALAGRLAAHHPCLALTTGSADPDGFAIVVNATPLGMAPGDPLPFAPQRIAPDAFVGEVVMARDTTPFLAAARARGAATQVGIDMLFEMIPAYLEFFGLPATSPETLRRLAHRDD